MEEFQVNSFDDFSKIIQEHNATRYLFRGHSSVDWELLPKVGRLDYRKSWSKSLTEENILEAWKRYGENQLNSTPLNDWDWLTLSQHHGLATRLLDWTKNPLVALFFAVEYPQMDCDGCIYILDFKDQPLNTNDLNPFSITKSGVFYPKGLSARIINQRGMLSISHEPNTPFNILYSNYTFKKMIIKKNSMAKLRKVLDMFGVTEFAIYQDLDSLSRHLNRFVIDRNFDVFR